MPFPHRLQPLRWDIDPLAAAAARGLPNVPASVLKVRYPFRLLRYWFMHQMMVQHAQSQTLPLSVAEVGVDEGQQLAFAAAAAEAARKPAWWQRWDAFDCAPATAALTRQGYTDVVTTDLERPDCVAGFGGRSYDVVIALHVLEHLHDPEAGVRHLASLVKPGGLLIGGGPVTPHIAHAWWQARIRRRAQPRGHVSVLSPKRLQEMARSAGLVPEWQGGAFLMRKRGFPLENRAWWLNLNLAFGALVPGWPGEIYFSWRRAASPNAATVTPLPQGTGLHAAGGPAIAQATARSRPMR
jgi:SAM-dependent methyltransferase